MYIVNDAMYILIHIFTSFNYFKKLIIQSNSMDNFTVLQSIVLHYMYIINTPITFQY